jgi:hypothetical protein
MLNTDCSTQLLTKECSTELLTTDCSTELLTYLAVLTLQSEAKYNISCYLNFTATQNIF